LTLTKQWTGMLNMSMFSSYVDQMHLIMLKYTAYKCVVYVMK